MRRRILSIVFFFCGISPVLAGDFCPFLSDEDVERVTGRKQLFQLTSMPLPDEAGPLLDSGIARCIVFSGENSERLWENMFQQSGRTNLDRIPILDFGDKSYALHLEPRNEHEYPTALIVVTRGPDTAVISVRAMEGEPANAAQPQAIELAKLVMARLAH